MTWALALTLLLAFGLRVHGLDSQSLWYDEGFSVGLASQGWRQILLGELNLPPLYNLLLGGWARLAGHSEFAARYLSVFWGLLVVALGGVLGAQLFGPRAGVLAALFLALSPIEVWYAQEARMYATLAALSLASTVCLVRLMRGDRRARLWALYAALSVAALYTHYYAVLVLAAQAVWAFPQLLRGRDWRFARWWFLAQALVGVSLLPWLRVLWRQWRAASATYWPGLLSWQDMATRTALGFAGEGLMVSRQAALMPALLAGGFAALGLVAGLRRTRSRWGALLLAAYVIVPFTGLYLLLRTRPKYSPRYLLPVVPGLLLLAANGVAALWPQSARRWHDVGRAGLALAVGGGLAAGSVYAATNPLRDQRFGRDDFRGAAAFLSRAVAPDEAIILLSGHLEPVFAYYYPQLSDNCYPLPPGLPPSPSVDDVVTLDVLDDLNEVIRGRRGVWLLLWQDDVVDPNGVVLTVFDRVAQRVSVEERFRGLDLRHYLYPSGAPLRREMFGRTPINATVGQEELLLVGCDLPPGPVPSGGVATVLFYWQAIRPTPLDYRLSLAVIDELGQVRAGSDGRVAAHMYPTNRWRPGRLVMAHRDIDLPLALPPGEYTLQARIYPLGSESAQVVPLGRFQVGRAGRPPTLAELGISAPLGVSLAELELLSYEVSPRAATPGQTVYLTVYWRASSRPAQVYRTALLLGGQPWNTLPLPASVAGMEPGDVIKVQYPLSLPRDAPGGPQPLAVALQDGSGRPVSQSVTLTEYPVQARERIFEVPETIGNPAHLKLGDRVTFLGHDLDRDVLRPGDTVHLTLYWQATQAMDTSYTVFTHLLDDQQRIWGQADSIPAGGDRPTTGWLPGEVLVDTYDITVRSGAPPGLYVVEVGLYDAATGDRLAVRDPEGNRLPDDRILLSPLEVLPPGGRR